LLKEEEEWSGECKVRKIWRDISRVATTIWAWAKMKVNFTKMLKKRVKYTSLLSNVKIYTLIPQYFILFLLIYQKYNNLTHFVKKYYCETILI